uniref:Uncharacterized protein n=1 Tax=Arundo donax TaxID=35708 RepID=A0A0A9B8C2_ARUDO
MERCSRNIVWVARTDLCQLTTVQIKSAYQHLLMPVLKLLANASFDFGRQLILQKRLARPGLVVSSRFHPGHCQIPKDQIWHAASFSLPVNVHTITIPLHSFNLRK